MPPRKKRPYHLTSAASIHNRALQSAEFASSKRQFIRRFFAYSFFPDRTYHRSSFCWLIIAELLNSQGTAISTTSERSLLMKPWTGADFPSVPWRSPHFRAAFGGSAALQTLNIGISAQLPACSRCPRPPLTSRGQYCPPLFASSRKNAPLQSKRRVPHRLTVGRILRARSVRARPSACITTFLGSITAHSNSPRTPFSCFRPPGARMLWHPFPVQCPRARDSSC